jgi:hypothetical protein
VKEKSEALSEERIFPEMAPRPKHSISSGLSWAVLRKNQRSVTPID